MKLKEKLTSRDLQAIERREQILKASKELFAANGYHATTTRLICKKINMADGLIYHYFPDGKLEILRKVIEEFGYSNLKSADEKVSAISYDTPIQEIIISLFQIFFEFSQKDSDLITILLREQNNFPNDLSIKFKRYIKKLVYKIAKLLKHKVVTNEIRNLPYNMMVNQLWGSLTVFLIQNMVFKDKNLLQMTVNQYIESSADYIVALWV